MEKLLLALLIFAGLFQLGLAGCAVSARRYRPEWWGLACLAAALTWPIIRTLTA